jgi:hypothetical protein
MWEIRGSIGWLVLLVPLPVVVLISLLNPRYMPNHMAYAGTGGFFVTGLVILFVIQPLCTPRIVITPDEVVVRGPLTYGCAARGDVSCLQVSNSEACIVNHAGRTVLSLRAAWSWRKYESLAAQLGVTLYDRRVIPGSWRDPTDPN